MSKNKKKSGSQGRSPNRVANAKPSNSSKKKRIKGEEKEKENKYTGKPFTVKIEKYDGFFIAKSLEVGTIAQGYTKKEAMEDLKKATALDLETSMMLDLPSVKKLKLDQTIIQRINLNLDFNLDLDLGFDFKVVETEIKRKKSGDCQATHDDIGLELIFVKSRLIDYGDEEDRARYKTLTALLERDEADLPTLGELGIDDAYY